MPIQTLDSNDARLRWRSLLDAARAGEDTVIERYGEPTAAVIPFEDYAAIQEILDDLRAARRAEAVLAEYQADPTTARPWREVMAELEEESSH
jgi:prevent-host-death family protein